MKNLYETNGDITAIHLNRKDGTVLHTLIDTSDLPIASSYNGTWTAHKDTNTGAFYAKNYHGEYLHRKIMGAGRGDIVDHRHHNTLDNRRDNLRKTDKAGNARNRKGATKVSRSGIRGVAWDKKAGQWRAYIWLKGRNEYLGWYPDKYEAGRVATKARLEHFGSHSVDRVPIKL